MRKPEYKYAPDNPTSRQSNARNKQIKMSPAPRRSTFLVIHGAWHHPELYGTFCKAIENRGAEVICPRLPSCSGELPSTKTIEDDVALIRATAESLVQEGKKVFAVMHSYGGMVGTDALEGLGLQRLIYLAAFVPPSGKNLVDMLGGSMAPFIVGVSSNCLQSSYIFPTVLFRCSLLIDIPCQTG